MQVTPLVSTGGTNGPVWKMPRLPGRNSTANFVFLHYGFAISRWHQPASGSTRGCEVSRTLAVHCAFSRSASSDPCWCARDLNGRLSLEASITNAKNAIVETTRNSGVSRVGSEAHPFKERFDCRPLSAARICSAVNNAAGNDECNLGSEARRSIRS
jgi:hypothetical protein